jgi:hypothetical protein
VSVDTRTLDNMPYSQSSWIYSCLNTRRGMNGHLNNLRNENVLAGSLSPYLELRNKQFSIFGRVHILDQERFLSNDFQFIIHHSPHYPTLLASILEAQLNILRRRRKTDKDWHADRVTLWALEARNSSANTRRDIRVCLWTWDERLLYSYEMIQ